MSDHIENDECIKSLYMGLKTGRDIFEDSAVESARNTIPALFVQNEDVVTGNHHRETIETPPSSVGATALNGLSTSLLLAVFPSGSPFFRYQIDQERLIELEAETAEQGGDFKKVRTQIEQSLRKVEQLGLEVLESVSTRPIVFELLRQYLIAQTLVHQDPETGELQIFKLSQHVNVRDQKGNVLMYITEEGIDPRTLDKDIIEEAGIDISDLPDKQTSNASRMGLYTKIELLDSGVWEEVQEINGVRLESTVQTYKSKEDLPWFDIAFNRIPGEAYGRGYVEQHLGHLRVLNGLTRAVEEGALISSQTLFLVNPASATTPEKLVNTPNGGFVRGRDGDVVPLKVDKANDYSVALEAMGIITREIQVAFMSNLAARRDAERVTKEEFATIAAEIDQTLGGTFSRLAVEFQLPLARGTTKVLETRGLVKNLREAGVKPNIVTGIAAIGRGTDLNRLRAFMNDIGQFSQIPGLEQLGVGLDVAEARLRLANGHGVNASGLIRTQDELDEEREAAEAEQEAQLNAAGTQDLLGKAIQNPEGGEMVLGELSALGQEAQGVVPAEEAGQIQ